MNSVAVMTQVSYVRAAGEQRTPEPDPSVIIEGATGFWLGRALLSVLKLGVADHLIAGPKTVDDLAAAVGAHSRALYRLLRALASEGLLTELEARRFELTPAGVQVLGNAPHSARHLILAQELFWDAWSHLDYSLRTGRTAFGHVHGRELFEYLSAHPDKARTFNDAMTSFVSQTSAAVVEAYDFARFRHVVDVGGGHGMLMSKILRANPGARGTVFDQGSVISGARLKIDEVGLAGRCECVDGDFFKVVPSGGDAYVLASIIHDWDDEHSAAILRNCREAMESGRPLLLIEMVIPTGDAPSFGKLQDLAMLVTTGGQERTEAEYRALLSAAGFRLNRVVPTRSPASVVEAIAT